MPSIFSKISVVNIITVTGLPRWLSGKKNPSANAGAAGSIPGLERSLVEEMASHSSILAGIIPWPEEPGRLSPWSCKELNVTEHTCITFIILLFIYLIIF